MMIYFLKRNPNPDLYEGKMTIIVILSKCHLIFIKCSVRNCSVFCEILIYRISFCFRVIFPASHNLERYIKGLRTIALANPLLITKRHFLIIVFLNVCFYNNVNIKVYFYSI